jgi:L-histidine Nalpha-methyltransferase
MIGFGENLMPSQTESPSRIGNLKESLKPDFVKRKDAQKEIQRLGFENFGDTKILEIGIQKIEKIIKSTDHSLSGIRGFPEREAVQKISGTASIESPIFGTAPISFQWRAMPERHNAVKDFVWNYDIAISMPNEEHPFYCHAERQCPGIPSIVSSQARKSGLSAFDFRESPGYDYFLSAMAKVERSIADYIDREAFSQEMTSSAYDHLSFQIKSEFSTRSKEELQKELAESLEKGIVDGKFLYVMGGAEKFLEVAKAETYELSNAEKTIIRENADEIASLTGEELLDFGCGDGTKAKIILEATKDNDMTVKYRPVDISPRIIFEASARMPKEVGTEGRILDFSKSLPQDLKTTEKSTFALLGSTLGNGDRVYQENLMKNFASAMQKKDNFLVGVQLNYDFEEILRRYQNPEVFSFALPMLKKFGLEKDDAEIFVSGNREKQEVSLNIKLLKNKEISVGENKVKLPAGKIINLIVSHKYELPEMEHLAETAGLKINKSFLNKESSYGLFVLEK